MAFTSTTSARAAEELPFNKGWSDRFGYFDLAPGLLAVQFRGGAAPFYAWGLACGGHLPLGPKGAAQLGAFFEHEVGGSARVNERIEHFIRVGPELRLGGHSRRWFGYGLLRLGLDVHAVNYAHDNERGGVSGTAAGFLLTVGGGVLFSVEPRFVLGGEPAVDISALSGPGSPIVGLRLRFFLGWRF